MHTPEENDLSSASARPEARGAEPRSSQDRQPPQVDAHTRQLPDDGATCAEPLRVRRDVSPLPDPVDAAAAEEPVGEDDADAIGPYRVIGLLGTGGMGEVLLAERSDGEFEQRVAIKRMRGEFAPSAFLERFRRERQILAGLDHPGIARLLDGGSTREGDPYIVLELVEGEWITDWCSRRGTGLEDRLRLVCEVADAVDAAHHKLVVHRDLKPSNILVNADGQPKLLDFGIAKMLGDDPVASLETQLHGRTFTAAYAAPEQILGQPVTTATDVFALGILLYELLTGQQPFVRDALSIVELAREVEDEAFTRPSVAAAEASGRDPSVRRFAAQLEGDLDTIVAKALHREPTRRYASAAALSEDLVRYLGGHPVAARPDQLGYRLGKLVRRHRLVFAVGTAALVLLVAAVVAFGLRLATERDLATQAAERAEAERAQAELARLEAVRVTEFLVGLFGEANPLTAGSREPTAREILDRGGERLARELAGEPAVRVRLEQAIARAYLGLMRPTEALRHAQAAREALHAAGGGDPEAMAQILLVEAAGRLLAEEYGAAEVTAQAAIESLEATPASSPELLGIALRYLGASLVGQGRFSGAEELLRRAITLLAPYGAADPQLLLARLGLAEVLHQLGRNAEARAELSAILAVVAVREDRLAVRAEAVHALGMLARDEGELELAEALYRQSLALTERLDGPASPRLVDSLSALGFLASKRGDPDAALELYVQAQGIAESTASGNTKPLEGIATVLHQTGRLDEAAKALEQLLARRRATQGENTSDVAWTLYELGSVERARGRTAAARTRFEASLAAFERSVGPQHRWASWPLHELGVLALASGDAAHAEAHLARALALREARLPQGRPEIAESRAALAEARAALRSPSSASR